MSLDPTQQLNLQNSTNAKNRFWKPKILQATFLLMRKTLKKSAISKQ